MKITLHHTSVTIMSRLPDYEISLRQTALKCSYNG